MNNVEKGYVLAKLFPEILKELTAFIQQETERFKEHEQYMRSIWVDKTLITSDFWYALVDNTANLLKRHNVMLHKSPRVFSDQLFDGLNAIFLTNCLIEFAEKEECDRHLKQAIHLLFGQDKMIVITPNE